MHFLACSMPLCLFLLLTHCCPLQAVYTVVCCLCYDCSSTICSNLASTETSPEPNHTVCFSLQDSLTAGKFTLIYILSKALLYTLMLFSENSPAWSSFKRIWVFSSSSLKYMFIKLILIGKESPLSLRYDYVLSNFGFWVYVNHTWVLKMGLSHFLGIPLSHYLFLKRTCLIAFKSSCQCFPLLSDDKWLLPHASLQSEEEQDQTIWF